MIRIKKSDYEAVVAYARAGLPNEVCGLIGGKITPDEQVDKAETRTIEKVYYLKNLDASNEHFSMDPKEQFAAVKDMRALGLVPLGNFHSHPETPSRPSQEDIRLAYDSKASYLILSLEHEDKPVLKAFRVVDGKSSEESLEII